MKFPYQLYDQDGKKFNEQSILYDQSSYVLEFAVKLSNEEKEYIKRNYSSILRHYHGSMYALEIKNQIGRLSLFGRSYEIQSRKWNEEKVNELWQEISREAATLPFHAFSVSRREYESSFEEQQKVHYHQWIFIRDELLYRSDLQTAWQTIVRDPNTILLQEDQTEDPSFISRIHERSWQHLIEHGEVTRISENHPLARTDLARQLSRQMKKEEDVLFPNQIRESIKYITHDTRENRFLKYVLLECKRVTDWMETYLSREMSRRSIHLLDEWWRDNVRIRQLIQQMMTVHWMDEVGEYQGFLGNSTVMQQRQGYRQWFSFYQELLQGIRYPWERQELGKLVESKTIDKMYEYWCLFQVLQAVEKSTGLNRQNITLKTNAEFGVYLGEGTCLEYRWKNQPLRIYYNKTFRKGFESYSIELRPDISLYWKGAWHHFDAKYKQTDHFVKEDVHTMHVYKDAIRGTVTSVALYPACGTKTMEFFSEKRDLQIPIQGVGSMHLMVGEENHFLFRWIQLILHEVPFGKEGNK